MYGYDKDLQTWLQLSRKLKLDTYGFLPYCEFVKPTRVFASKRFEKQLKRLPKYIKQAAAVWIASVEEEGIREVRKLKGYHDEPLKGKRAGERSIRLSKAYRLIYEEDEQGKLVIINILEVHKHEY